MVLDPHLAQHLSHWGINMLQVGLGKCGKKCGIVWEGMMRCPHLWTNTCCLRASKHF